MNYNFKEIEAKWQHYWAKYQTFKAENRSDKKKFYVLDMFPYPSGAGLHVGHPLGYIASDIYARYKRHKGFNVLHPMGYDSFGLPAEQYAIQTGQHPANTTEINIEGCLDGTGKILMKYVNEDGTIHNSALIDKQKATTIRQANYQENIIQGYRRQLDKIGFSFDWSREVRTSDPNYYKWTQWIFIQLFNSWYNKATDKAEDIADLLALFEKEGNENVNAVCDEDTPFFSASDWKNYSDTEKQEVLLKYRLTYLAETEVNWCPALGTVLANDEIVNGVSERGGHPVIRKKMTQWSMRITAYAQRLLDGLAKVDWPQPLKDSQTNWIGRSEGAEVVFKVLPPAPSEGGGAKFNTSSLQADLPLALSQGGGMDSGAPKYVTSDSKIYGVLLERAKEMRQNPILAEKALWEALRKRNLDHRFRRQHPIADYIVDFVCLEKELIIEVDGEIHQYQLNKDSERQLVLEQKKGYTVLRFSNEEVLNDLDKVLAEIEAKLNLKTNSPSLGGGWGEVSLNKGIRVFTTRPDTIFGVSFMVLAPEHELVKEITTPDQKAEVEAYIEATAKRSERDRMADVKTITGAFTGAYVEHPFTLEPIPVWIGDYVLAGYGTGAVMSVPCGDQRDYDFAKHFDIPIPNIFEGIDISEEAFSDKEKTIIANSDFLDGLKYKDAVKKVIAALEDLGQGKGKVNYRLRDAVFSRQRYWGEPFPVYYKDGMPQMIDPKFLPIELPEVEKYLPTETGEPPLGNAKKWYWLQYGDDGKIVSKEEFENSSPLGRLGGALELNTMPGWAGSSQYFNRYMDPHNEEEIFSKEAIDYWQDVDLYIGGSEHATGHLLYSRFWQKFMFDKGLVPKAEFAKKLINQGMITGTSAFVFETIYEEKSIGIYWSLRFFEGPDSYTSLDPIFEESENIYKKKGISKENISRITYRLIRVPVSFVNASDELDIEAFKNWLPEYKDAEFIYQEGDVFKAKREVEKMSKSKYNVVSPDAICEQYGADSLRLYEMFLGPLEQSKPWNTAGITGVHGFLKKLWRLYHSGPENTFYVMDSPPLEGQGEALGEALRTLHKTIKKVEEDIENFSFNTSVSTFMICVNELTALKCNSREILEPLAILISPYAPHIAEELWEKLGHTGSIATVPFPTFDAKYLVESSKAYPISFNGKVRFTLELPMDMKVEEIEAAVLAHHKTKEQLQGRPPKKVIVVPGKIVNIVG